MSFNDINNSKVKFALVEPISFGNIIDRPDLGCAMLIGVCNTQGIKTSLIKGQNEWFEYLYNDGLFEIWSLMEELNELELNEQTLTKHEFYFVKRWLKLGFDEIQNRFREQYYGMIYNKSAQLYFNRQQSFFFFNAIHRFDKILQYFLENQEGKRITIVDHYVDKILKTNPCAVGFSIFYAYFDPLTRAIRRRIKETSRIPVIIGGAGTASLDSKIYYNILKEQYADYLVIGMAEYSLPILIKSLVAGKKSPQISGVYGIEDTELFGTSMEAAPALDLNQLPFPDFTQYDLNLFPTLKRILPLQSARGCTWRKCAFCTHHLSYNKKYIMFSVDRFIETVLHLKETYQCSHFALHDEEIPAARARKISSELIKRQTGELHFYSYGRFDKQYDNKDLLRLMRQAGFSTIAWGMESGSQKVLDLMNKNTETAVMSSILKKSHEAGITNICFVMFGFPGETEKDAQMTVRFLEINAYAIDLVIGGVFNLRSESPIGLNPKRWGIKRIGVDNQYTIKEGMNNNEAIQFNIRFNKKRDFLNSGKYGTLLSDLPDNINRMMCFLISSNPPLPNQKILEYLDDGKTNLVFPVLIGKIREKQLYSINLKLSLTLNKIKHIQEFDLSPLEIRLFIDSNGNRSIEEILALNAKRKNQHQENISPKSLAFYKSMYLRGHGLGFAKPW